MGRRIMSIFVSSSVFLYFSKGGGNNDPSFLEEPSELENAPNVSWAGRLMTRILFTGPVTGSTQLKQDDKP